MNGVARIRPMKASAPRAVSRAADRGTWTIVALAAGLTLLALALRLPGLHQSLFGDELFAADEVIGRGFGGMLSAIHHSPEVTPPLYFSLAWLSTKVFPGLEALRTPSLVLGTAVVPLAFVLGRRISGTAAGAVGALLLALSPFAMFYSDEARPYATVAFLSCLSTFALLRALGDRRFVWWVIYTLAVGAVMYTHYTSIFVVGTQALWALWYRRDRLREVIGATAVAGILYIPWLPFLGDKNQLAIYGGVDLGSLPRSLAQAFPGHPFALPRVLPGVPALAVLCAAVAAALVLVLASTVARREGGRARAEIEPRVVLLVLLAIATPAGLALYSVASGDNLLLPRNLSASLPAVALLTGTVLTAPSARVAATGLTLLAVAAVGVGTVKALGDGFRRPDTKAAAALIDSRAPGRASVIDLQYVPADNPTSRALTTYLRRPHPLFTAQRRDDAWRLAARRRTDVFVAWTESAAFGSLSILAGPPPRYRRRFALVRQWRYPGIFSVFVRQYAPTT